MAVTSREERPSSRCEDVRTISIRDFDAEARIVEPLLDLPTLESAHVVNFAGAAIAGRVRRSPAEDLDGPGEPQGGPLLARFVQDGPVVAARPSPRIERRAFGLDEIEDHHAAGSERTSRPFAESAQA